MKRHWFWRILMPVYEKAEDCFKRLTTDASPKFVKNITNIKDACDKLETAKANITYSAVGKMAISIHGGPKPQSILNNTKHKDYIDCRARESNKAIVSSKSVSKELTYPASDLDQRTRRYIDGLQQRNTLLENTMQELKQRLKIETTKEPVDVAILLGNQVNLDKDNELSPQAKKALLKLINEIPSMTDSVELFQGCSLRYRTGDWVLSPSVYKEITDYLIFNEGT